MAREVPIETLLGVGYSFERVTDLEGVV